MDFVDERTLAALDFGQIRTRLADYARSDRGRELLLELRPTGDWLQAARLSQAVEQMRTLIGEGFALDPIPATDLSLTKARRGATLTAVELGEIGRALHAADTMVRAIRASNATDLQKLVEPARSFRELSEDLRRAFGPRGEIFDTASPELARIRRAQLGALDAARARVTAIASSAGFSQALQDSIVTQRGDRFVVPVKAEFAGRVAGIVHDSSASGQTIFVEPLGVIEANNRVRTLALDAAHEIERLLTAFSARIGNQAATIIHLLAIAVDVDLIHARAHVAREMTAIAPEYRTQPGLALNGARHPLLRGTPVAQTVALSPEQALIIISGPNMGGKTVALKLVALFVVMAACGLHVPAEPGTQIGPFSAVIAEIGDAQSLATDSSTFAAHLRRLRAILEAARPGLLFVVDEIASGTETASGAALAQALLDDCLDAGAMGIVTTHAQELKTYAQARALVVNGGMRFLPDTHEPTFELDIGVPGRSLALDLAAREGFPAGLLARARERIGPAESAYDQALAELSRARAAVQRREFQLRDEELRQQNERAQLDAQRKAFQAERAAILEAADVRLHAVLDDFAAELRTRTPATTQRLGRSQIELLGAARARVEAGLPEAAKNAASSEVAGPFRVGMTVAVAGFSHPATILDLSGREATVAMGALRMNVDVGKLAAASTEMKNDVRRLARDERRRANVHEAQLERVASTSMELDVRGARVHEALPLVEAWLDQAMQSGVSPVRLIHGKGTGALGTGLQAELSVHPRVVDIRYGNENEGGGGVSIITLR